MYNLHLDSVDGDLPVSAVLTAASVHDSQVAIPLAQMTAQRVASLYDLMDAAYDAPRIEAFTRHLAHVPIIDANPRRGDPLPMEPARAVRFRERSTAERVNSNLKDNCLCALQRPSSRSQLLATDHRCRGRLHRRRHGYALAACRTLRKNARLC